MKYILDTHTFIWANTDPNKLSTKATKTIIDNAPNIYLSAVSIWEMSIKASLNNLGFNDIGTFVNQGCKFLNCKVLPILVPHLLRVETLENFKKHKDPFDRLIIAQSIITGYPVISIDENFDLYPIKRIW